MESTRKHFRTNIYHNFRRDYYHKGLSINLNLCVAMKLRLKLVL